MNMLDGQCESDEPRLNRVEMVVCDGCLDGVGGECHVPGCALWMSVAPDVPIRDNAVTVTLDV